MVLILESLAKRQQGIALEDLICPAPTRDDSRSSLAHAQKTDHIGVPRRGHVLSTVVEIYGKPIRDAVAALSASLTPTQSGELRAALLCPLQGEDPTRSDAEMAAWAIVSMWVVGVAVEALNARASLADAEVWFLASQEQGKRLMKSVSAHALHKADKALWSEADPSAYLQLLPYILDPHGPGSRLSVQRDPATRSARKRKRNEGVFYTPTDVAEYMATACLATSEEHVPTIFDPTCGTGVF